MSLLRGGVYLNDINIEKLKTLRKMYAILKVFNFDFNMYESSKETRIVFQKLVYISQRNRFNLGYHYNLYLNGPYSPGLAEDGYFMVRNMSQFTGEGKEFKLSASGMEKVKNIRFFIDNKVNDSKWLETIGTLDYLVFETKIRSKRDSFIKFKSIKPTLYDERILNKAWELLDSIQ